MRLTILKTECESRLAVPASITLGVTLIQLVGELMQGSHSLLARAAGRDAPLIGIVWLVPIFGIYFARKLVRQGKGPRSPGRVLGVFFLGLLGYFGLMVFLFYFFSLDPDGLGYLALFSLASVALILISLKPWPELGRLLLAYALTARIPVALIMLFENVPTPGFAEHWGHFSKWILFGLIPQMTIWIAFTTIIGGFFGSLASLRKTSRQRPTESAA